MRSKVLQYVITLKDKVTGKLDPLAKKLGLTAGQFAMVGAAATAMAVAAVAAFKKVVDEAKKVVQEMAVLGDSFDKLSARTSVNVESLSEWVFLMERAGGTQGNLEAAIRRLTKSMYDQTRGLSTAVDAWDAIGVSVTDSEGNLREVNDVLLDLADALAKEENATRALGLSQDLLGRGAAQMVALLSQGRPELQRQIALFEKFNGTMEKGFTDGAAAVIDAQTDLKWSIRGLKADLTEPIQPVLAEVIDEVAGAVGSLGRWVSENKEDVRAMAEGVGNMAIAIVKAAKAAGEFVDGPGGKLLYFMVLSSPTMKGVARDLNLIEKMIKSAGDAAGEAADKVEPIDWSELTGGGPIELGPFTPAEALAGAMNEARARLIEEAESVGVAVYETIFNPGSGVYETIARSSEDIAKELTTKLNEALSGDIAEAPTIAPDWTPADYAPEGGEERLMLLEEILAAEKLLDEQLNGRSEFEKQYNAEWLAANAERRAEIDAELEAMYAQRKAQEELAAVVESVGANFERLASNSLSAMLQGKDGAIMFGRALKGIVMDALAAVLAKMLAIQAVKLFTGLPFAQGGTVPALAAGGTIPRAAVGYAVPDGPRGMDSRLVAAMPGEEVIRRSLSQRLDRFLNANEAAAMVDPFDINSGSGGGNVSVAMQVARPVSYLDAIDLGEHAAVAAKKIKEAEL